MRCGPQGSIGMIILPGSNCTHEWITFDLQTDQKFSPAIPYEDTNLDYQHQPWITVSTNQLFTCLTVHFITFIYKTLSSITIKELLNVFLLNLPFILFDCYIVPVMMTLMMNWQSRVDILLGTHGFIVVIIRGTRKQINQNKSWKPLYHTIKNHSLVNC